MGVCFWVPAYYVTMDELVDGVVNLDYVVAARVARRRNVEWRLGQGSTHLRRLMDPDAERAIRKWKRTKTM